MRTEGRVVPNVVKNPYGTVLSTLRAAATTSAACTSTTTNLTLRPLPGLISRPTRRRRRPGCRGRQFTPLRKPLRGQPQRGVHPRPQVLNGDDRSQLHQLRLVELPAEPIDVPPGRHRADLLGGHVVLHRASQ